MTRQLSDLAHAIDARLAGADTEFSGAAIDSRAIAPGALFFALPGAHTDGHRHVDAAADAGAAAAVVSRLQDTDLPQLEVADPARALTATGRFVRRQFTGAVIGVTGSNGKTTVKQMLARVLAERGEVHATHGNLNNELGVPLTLAGLEDQESAVVEMAAGGPGEIAELAGVVEPDVAIVTNAGRAHLERFGSVDAVARTKGALYEHLAADGVAVINADDAYASVWRRRAGARRIVTFGLETGGVDVTANAIVAGDRDIRFELVMPAGRAAVRLPMPGRHNVANALAAAAAAAALGLAPEEISHGLSNVEGASGRLRVLSAGVGGAIVADDSYNANPESLASALDWLAHRPAPRWLVLGDMAELGDDAAALHAAVAERAAEARVEGLWTVGNLSRHTSAVFAGTSAHFDRMDELIAALTAALDSHAAPPTVLVKGSRSAGMERVVAAIGPETSRRAKAC